MDACQSCCPVLAFQTCTVPSFPLEARYFPSGDQGTLMTGPACPQYATSEVVGVGVPVDAQMGVAGGGIWVTTCAGVVAIVVGVGDGLPCAEPQEEPKATSKTNRQQHSEWATKGSSLRR